MSEAAPSIMIQSWPSGSQIAVKINFTNTINSNHVVYLEGHLFSSTYLLTNER